MKKLSIYFFVMLMTAFVSCEKDESIVVLKQDGTAAQVTSSSEDLGVEINAETLANNLTIRWNEADYGINTEVKYTIEMDVVCNGFNAPVVIGTTTNEFFELTLDALNAKLLSGLRTAQHIPSEVQLRVKSDVKGQFGKISEPVTFTLTPFSQWSKGVWLLSNGWTDANAPAVFAKEDGTYDGYVFLGEGSTFRLADIRTCDKTLFGGSEGALSDAVLSDELSVEAGGYYRLKADLENLTYEFTFIDAFGIIGTATAGGWGSSTALEYNEGAQTWELTTDLTSGALKFRANDQWTINYGPANSNDLDGTLRFDDPAAISIQEPGNYTIIADFTKTKSPDFTYSIKKNASGQAPAELWVPGDYQGWNFATAPTIKAINSSTFEGYVYISSPTGYKFTNSPDWDHVNYGNAGTEGDLTVDGLAPSLGLSDAGVYKFNVNVTTLKYTAVKIVSMGMVGPATAGGTDAGWNQSVAMTYDAASDQWSGTIDLAPGALKFRANNEWAINYGPADSNAFEGTLVFDDPGAISITEAGSYTVTLDMSRSKSPYKYSYKIVKN